LRLFFNYKLEGYDPQSGGRALGGVDVNQKVAGVPFLTVTVLSSAASLSKTFST
jgi:hypothetical protein